MSFTGSEKELLQPRREVWPEAFEAEPEPEAKGFLTVSVGLSILYLLTPRPGLYAALAAWGSDLVKTIETLLRG